jgi:mRNA deadenylase 3'-5' endonuclease subunit Ccr4
MIQRVRELQQQPSNAWSPPAGWQIAHLPLDVYEDPAEQLGPDGSAAAASTRLSVRQRLAARASGHPEPRSPPPRAGGGSGIIVVDSFGTASTTQALAAVPSTPLQAPAVRRISADGLQLSSSLIGAELLHREMLPVQECCDNSEADDSSFSSASDPSSRPPPFTLLTMNTLACALCDTRAFPHTDAAVLDWEARKHLLLDELVGAGRTVARAVGTATTATNATAAAAGANPSASAVALPASPPDVICAQEMDRFDEWFRPQLAARGYAQAFFQRKSGGGADGVAVFVRDGAFRVLRVQKIRLAADMTQVAILLQLEPLPGVETTPVNATAATAGTADSTAPLQQQRAERPRRRLYVATTHLKAKGGYELVRLKQAHLVLLHLQHFISRYHRNGDDDDKEEDFINGPIDVSPAEDGASANPPHSSLRFSLPRDAAVVLAGDFNDTPDSPAVRFVTEGSFTPSGPLVPASDAKSFADGLLAPSAAAAAPAPSSAGVAGNTHSPMDTSDHSPRLPQQPRNHNQQKPHQQQQQPRAHDDSCPSADGGSHERPAKRHQHGGGGAGTGSGAGGGGILFSMREAASSIFGSGIAAAASASTTSSLSSSSSASASAASQNASPFPAAPLTHTLWLHSLYNRLWRSGGGTGGSNHPGSLYTTSKRRGVLVERCIDYVFHSAASLRPTELLSIPDRTRCLPTYLPAVNYPSDHLAIAGTFEWKV